MASVLLYATKCDICEDFVPIVRRLRPQVHIIAHPSHESYRFILDNGFIEGYPVLIEDNIYYYGKRKILKHLGISKLRYNIERLILWVI